MNAYTDKVNYYHKQLETATEDQIPHFTAKKEHYLAKLRFAEGKYDFYTELFVGDEWVKHQPQDMK